MTQPKPPLSPAAQAVLNAFRAVPDLRDAPSIAAALQALVDNLSCLYSCLDDHGAVIFSGDDIFAIAAELENFNA